MWGKYHNQCLDDVFVEENANKYSIVYFSRLHSESWNVSTYSRNKILINRCSPSKQDNQIMRYKYSLLNFYYVMQIKVFIM